MSSNDWFDRKYEGDGQPSLKDKIEFLRGDSHGGIPNRLEKQWRKELSHALFELKRKYKPSEHIRAFHYLCCLAPYLTEAEADDLVERYEAVIKEQEENVTLHSNFSS